MYIQCKATISQLEYVSQLTVLFPKESMGYLTSTLYLPYGNKCTSPFWGCVMRVRLFVFRLALKFAPISFYCSLYLFQFVLIHYAQNHYTMFK